MGIVKRPSTKSVEAFIGGAPDATSSATEQTTKASSTVRGKQVLVSFTLPPDLLAKVNASAERLSISRAAFFKLAITHEIERLDDR